MKETEFAYRVRQALNEGADRLDYKTTFRLEQARKAALARHAPVQLATTVVAVPQLATAGAGRSSQESDSPLGLWRWIRGAGLAVPIVVLVLGFVGVHQWQHANSITESAALDFAVLLDDFPIDTYSEKGFGRLLTDEQRN
jgi:hypothetical protein